ncbi:MAG: Ca-activated chloride channel [Acidobacteriota bacterium]|nr:Ca-activated chloride channel [Acidobacteriota bacterium]
MMHERRRTRAAQTDPHPQYFNAPKSVKQLLALSLVAALLFSACQRERQSAAQYDDVVSNQSSQANSNSPRPQPTGLFTINDERAVANINKVAPAEGEFNTENYSHIEENPFLAAARSPLSTFSADVDTASYSNTRRFLSSGQLPPKDAVRIEELVNYFGYDYPEPAGDAPFSVTTEVSACPWDEAHRLVRIGLQGKRLSREELPPANLVFLVDVSGSMEEPNKLPLVQQSLRLLAEQLSARDHIAVVVYAGSSGLVLPSTSGERKGEIIAALDSLKAGGSTNGGEGIQLAYRIAKENFIRGGVNRVVLATDGDFNVGVTSEGDLVRLIEAERQGGVFLSVLGFGTGNVKDSTMEKLADHGNGNYAYVDSFAEARKVLGQQAGGTLATIAKDVKLQVEFNPHEVAGYRLIGYENRLLRDEDFNDDTKDAGEIGAGHTVTALYEVVPAGQKIPGGDVDALKYQKPPAPSEHAASREMLTLKVRYKEPQGEESKLLSVAVADTGGSWQAASDNFKFASAVAAFGMLLRDSKFKGAASYESVASLARSSAGADPQGYRQEFVRLVETARTLARQSARN